MSRKLGIFNVKVNNALVQLSSSRGQPLPKIKSKPITPYPQQQQKQKQNINAITIDSALKVVNKMELSELRSRTIGEYNYEKQFNLVNIRWKYYFE
ncbi:hypothetical protein JFL43_01385 [Viridibacillus sp. YIM B01967]|uniref:Uncharacterized protein n=1 Tax=Viridibacillus soli TaxID=2798301 RepID=A0ABS1H301_9BACL|nr:hypothetical protein [Viridibacillus soli]MBK3493542.1 hypothetical protein [Viridibacillus soli]